MTNVPPEAGTLLSYIVLAIIFVWIAFGIGTYLEYRRRWAAERGKEPDERASRAGGPSVAGAKGRSPD